MRHLHTPRCPWWLSPSDKHCHNDHFHKKKTTRDLWTCKVVLVPLPERQGCISIVPVIFEDDLPTGDPSTNFISEISGFWNLWPLTQRATLTRRVGFTVVTRFTNVQEHSLCQPHLAQSDWQRANLCPHPGVPLEWTRFWVAPSQRS